IDANGLFTTGESVGVATVTARSVAQPARSVQDTVTIGIGGDYGTYDSSTQIIVGWQVSGYDGHVDVSLAIDDYSYPDDVWEGTVSGNSFEGSEVSFTQLHYRFFGYEDPEQVEADPSDKLSATIEGGTFTGTATGPKWGPMGLTIVYDRE